MAEQPVDPTARADLPLEAVDRSKASNDGDSNTLGERLRKFRVIPILMICVAFGGIMGLYFQPPGLQLAMRTLGLEPGAGTSSPIAVPLNHTLIAEIDPAASPGPDTIIGLGALLPDGDVTTIAPPFGSGDARVSALLVDEGDQVTVGDTLAVLDNEAQYKAAFEAAEANVALQQANLEQTRTSIEASLKEARASLGSAEAAALSARKDYERAQSLIERGTISEAVLDQRRATSDQAARTVDQARATLSRYNVGDLETQVDVVVAARNYDAAKAALTQAERDLEKAYVRAPLTGTVLKIHVRPGEKPNTEGVMNIGNIKRMTAKVEIYQTQIGDVAVGNRVDITANALPTSLHGSVSHIGLEVERQRLIDDDPAANTDARIVEVTVLLDESSSEIAARYTNLQVVATIQTTDGP